MKRPTWQMLTLAIAFTLGWVAYANTGHPVCAQLCAFTAGASWMFAWFLLIIPPQTGEPGHACDAHTPPVSRYPGNQPAPGTAKPKRPPSGTSGISPGPDGKRR